MKIQKSKLSVVVGLALALVASACGKSENTNVVPVNPGVNTNVSLIGTWVETAPNPQGLKRKLVISANAISVVLDCYLSTGSVILGSGAFTFPAAPVGYRLNMNSAFTVTTTNSTGYCNWTLSSDFLQFNVTGATAVVNTTTGALVGTFARQ